jgi:hypothetical protein
MWKALTIDMGWSYQDWLKSTTTPPKEQTMEWTDKPWRSEKPISVADAIQQASNADEALAEVRALRAAVDAQGQTLAAILEKVSAPPA